MDMNSKLQEDSDYILSYFRNCKVGQGLFLLRTINARQSSPTYYSVINILLFNGFISSADDHFFRLDRMALITFKAMNLLLFLHLPLVSFYIWIKSSIKERILSLMSYGS